MQFNPLLIPKPVLTTPSKAKLDPREGRPQPAVTFGKGSSSSKGASSSSGTSAGKGTSSSKGASSSSGTSAGKGASSSKGVSSSSGTSAGKGKISSKKTSSRGRSHDSGKGSSSVKFGSSSLRKAYPQEKQAIPDARFYKSLIGVQHDPALKKALIRAVKDLYPVD